MLTYEEAFKNATQYFNGEELPASTFLTKYAIKEPNSGLFVESTPEEMHRRLAREFFKALRECPVRSKVFPTEEDVFKLFKGFKYIIPQGSVMSQLGHPYQIGSLSNCFVIGQPVDSYGGILQKDQEMVQLMKRRGGVGLDISTLRPAGTKVSNAANTSTGAVSFMHRYSNSTREVAQDGRRGALMLSMDIRHPESIEFARVKQDLTQVTGANISLFLTDDFMDAAINNRDYLLRWPLDSSTIIEVQSVVTANGNTKNLWMDINDPNLPFAGFFPYGELKKVKLWGKEEYIYVVKVSAAKVWEEIVKCAHTTAEPGLMFIDRLINYSPDGIYPAYKGVTTNPCSEIFMQPYDACRLICLNLLSMVSDPFTSEARLDIDLLYRTAYMQQLLADTLVDIECQKITAILEKINSDPEPREVKQVEYDLWVKVLETAQSSRRTGSGFTALGDMLAAIGIKYDSNKAIEVIEEVTKIKMAAELDASIDLAEAHGAFAGWDPALELGMSSHSASFYYTIRNEFPKQWERMQLHGRRNVSWSTVAPTGTVSMMTETTAGIEPLFAPYYTRKKKINPNDKGTRVDVVDQNGDKWMEYPVLHPQLKTWYDIHGKQVLTRLGKEIQGDLIPLEMRSIEELDSIISHSPWINACAPDIDWKKRVEIQGMIQKYTTHSISSTINLPNDVSLEAVAEIYEHSWKKGLKGITVYRDGCRTGVLTTGKEPVKEQSFTTHDAPTRPKCLPVDIYTTISKGTKWNVLVGLYDGQPYEVFAVPHFTNKEHAELCKVKRGVYDVMDGDQILFPDITSPMSDEEETLTRLISTALRHGANITFVVEQLNKSHGDITSFSKAIARTLKKYADETRLISQAKCNECGSENVVFEEGCHNCKDCGASGCS